METEVSLLIFYFCSPLIILTIHFNLLQNLESHHVKLLAWQKGYPDQTVPRYLIDAFIYDLALLEREGQLTRSVRIFSGMLFQLLAPATLLVLLWRFSDYQSIGISSWHGLCLLFDLLLIGYFQRALNGKWRLPYFAWAMLILAAAQYSLLFYVLHTKNLPLPLQISMSDYENSNSSRIKRLKRVVIPFLNGEFSNLIMPRIEIDSYTSLTLDDKQPKLRMTFDGASDFSSWFLQSGTGLDLRNRNLIGAELQNADLRKSILESSQLQGANLAGARLAGANLYNAQLQGAILVGAQLQGASLREAHLQGASLYGAILQGTDLTSAQLHGANLTSAKLQGANFGGAQLQGATFNTKEINYNFSRENEYKQEIANGLAAIIQGEDDDETLTILQGAKMSDAQLLGARFNRRIIGQTIQKGSPDLKNNSVNWNEIVAMSGREKFRNAITKARERTAKPSPNLSLMETDYALSDALPDLCANSLLALTAGLKSGHQDFSEKPSANLINAFARLPEEPACKPHLREIVKWARGQNIAPEFYSSLEEHRKKRQREKSKEPNRKPTNTVDLVK
ncbi:pentapeptide repeat-containing protein [Pseudoduganella namucuonensis]|uniref:pentapeptide repeat-containing protein n=1 Tax=Pseudoduganella namucuonensis TaxID=1035707 RepID=UPI0015A6636E|nr:pentapeptide repeat-containing protein [Pseudoduganella namucuonensis]